MESRLVLGCGSIGYDVIQELRARPGNLLVAASDEVRVQTLRGEGIPARTVDVTDRVAIETAAADLGPISVVAVFGNRAAENRAAAEHAHTLFPSAALIAYTGTDATRTDKQALDRLTDHVVSPGEVVLGELWSRFGEDGDRLRDLRKTLDGIEGPLAIVTHANPDPDAIASALALQRIARAFGCDADVCYYGDISHQENRALVNLLEYELVRLSEGDDLSEYGGFALVDHSRPGINDGLPGDTEIDVIIDHHPPRGPVHAEFLDLRSTVGATSTLLVEYLKLLNIEVSPALATGLLFGIRVDTNEFSREVATADFEAAAWLYPKADEGVLEQIESPSVSPETLDVLASAIGNRTLADGALTSCVGYISDRDALSQAADQLLNMEGVTTTLVYGIRDGTVYLSGRTRGSDIDLGETLRDAFDQVGDAGGHAGMAGAQIDIGLLGDPDEEDQADLVGIVDDTVSSRFREAFSFARSRVLPPIPEGAYEDSGE